MCGTTVQWLRPSPRYSIFTGTSIWSFMEQEFPAKRFYGSLLWRTGIWRQRQLTRSLPFAAACDPGDASWRRRRIVLIGALQTARGKFGTSAYSASKAGLIALAKTVAREVARLGMLINVVEPGWVRTPLTDSLPQAVRDAALAESLVGKYVEPADVAAAVTFLCGPGAQQITGQILRVDGGQSLGSGSGRSFI